MTPYGSSLPVTKLFYQIEEIVSYAEAQRTPVYQTTHLAEGIFVSAEHGYLR